MRSSRAIAVLVALLAGGGCGSHSPYAGEEDREIKALSAQQIDDLLAGRGMGFAMAAELNGYPGPLHVLELADELELTAAQRRETQSIFAAMQRQAQELGRQLVAAERELDRRFGARSIDGPTLATMTAEIARLEGRLRAVHLDAHLQQTELLTADQIERYVELRGYDGGGHAGHH